MIFNADMILSKYIFKVNKELIRLMILLKSVILWFNVFEIENVIH
ncbi:MAG: hypothetical protein QG670_441 [Thermoproteota archaeon]|nr:hypothetical protein [Thermoproteota archaeon]